MSAIPEDNGNDDYWEDEWDNDAWHELSVLDKGQRNAESWGVWVLRLLAIAVAVPIILGLLVWLLILAV